MRKLMAVVALILWSTLAYATTLTCSLDRLMLHWTGNTRIDMATAQMLYEHECMNGHRYWLTSSQMNR